MNEFSQSVSIPICKKSISRQLSNLWLSQENCCENTDGFVENRKIVCDGSALKLVLRLLLFYLFCSSIVTNAVIVTSGTYEP
jgi:hypothetical protein